MLALKEALILLSIILLFLILIWRTDSNRKTKSEIVTLIQETLEAQDKRINEEVLLNYGEKSSLSWDTLYAFTQGTFDEELNAAMNGQYFQSIDVPEDHFWIILKKDHKIVGRAEFETANYGFGDLNYNNGEAIIPRKEAIFGVKQEKWGVYFYSKKD